MATLCSGKAPAMLGATSMSGKMSARPSLFLKLLALPTSYDALEDSAPSSLRGFEA